MKSISVLFLSIHFLLIGCLLPLSSFASEKTTKVAKHTSLAGRWSGFYLQPIEYRKCGFLCLSDNVKESEIKKVTFYLSIVGDGKKFEGTIREPNAFGPDKEKNPNLRANIKGEWSEQTVWFNKSYDTIPGDVKYEGTVDPDLMTIKGKWTASDGRTTSFELVRIEAP